MPRHSFNSGGQPEGGHGVPWPGGGGDGEDEGRDGPGGVATRPGGRGATIGACLGHRGQPSWVAVGESGLDAVAGRFGLLRGVLSQFRAQVRVAAFLIQIALAAQAPTRVRKRKEANEKTPRGRKGKAAGGAGANDRNSEVRKPPGYRNFRHQLLGELQSLVVRYVIEFYL